MNDSLARSLSNSLNTQIPAFDFDTDELVEPCYDFVEKQLGIKFERLPVEFVSQRVLGDAMIKLVRDVESLVDTPEPGPVRIPDSEWERGFLEVKKLASKGISTGANTFKGAAVGGLIRVVGTRVLGIYAQQFVDSERPRLLIVSENVISVATKCGFDHKDFMTWILTHEITHVAQMDSSTIILDAMRTHLTEATNTKLPIAEKKDVVKETVAMMSYIEGMADYIMDREGMLPESTINAFRSRVDLERENRSFWIEYLMKILGNKDQQYVQGKMFCERISEGTDDNKKLTGILFNADLIPSSEEIADPAKWIIRYNALK